MRNTRRIKDLTFVAMLIAITLQGILLYSVHKKLEASLLFEDNSTFDPTVETELMAHPIAFNDIPNPSKSKTIHALIHDVVTRLQIIQITNNLIANEKLFNHPEKRAEYLKLFKKGECIMVNCQLNKDSEFILNFKSTLYDKSSFD